MIEQVSSCSVQKITDAHLVAPANAASTASSASHAELWHKIKVPAATERCRTLPTVDKPPRPKGGLSTNDLACVIHNADARLLDQNVESSKMVHAALLLLMLEAVFTDLVSPSA